MKIELGYLGTSEAETVKESAIAEGQRKLEYHIGKIKIVWDFYAVQLDARWINELSSKSVNAYPSEQFSADLAFLTPKFCVSWIVSWVTALHIRAGHRIEVCGHRLK